MFQNSVFLLTGIVFRESETNSLAVFTYNIQFWALYFSVSASLSSASTSATFFVNCVEVLMSLKPFPPQQSVVPYQPAVTEAVTESVSLLCDSRLSSCLLFCRSHSRLQFIIVSCPRLRTLVGSHPCNRTQGCVEPLISSSLSLISITSRRWMVSVFGACVRPV